MPANERGFDVWDLSTTKEDAPYQDHENVVPKVDLDGNEELERFLYCIKFQSAHRQDASEFICGTEENPIPL